MPTYKDKQSGNWYVSFYYEEYNGQKRKIKKSGFKTQREAKEYERNYLNKSHADAHLTFENLVELYLEDCKARLKLTTYEGKKFLFKKNITPFFKGMKIENIQAKTVRLWQNKLIEQGYKKTYLKTIHNQLSAIFNFAVKFYGLHDNPARLCGSMGSKHSDRIQFWTVEQFKIFDTAISDKPLSHTIFNILFWTGMRSGETLALTISDFDFIENTISINKNYARINNEDLILEPKTVKSKRIIDIPKFLCDIVQEYISQLYDLKPNDRIFPITKHYLNHEMNRGSKKAGIPKIRVHDLRHSHASLLINSGFSPIVISERLGHENIETTLQTYSHLYPSTKDKVIEKLEFLYQK